MYLILQSDMIISYITVFQVVIFFEIPSEPIADNSTGVNRSQTDDSLYKSDHVNSVRNGGPNNAPLNASVVSPTDISRLNVTDGPSKYYKNGSDQKIPPTSQSVPEFQKYDAVGGRKHSHKNPTNNLTVKTQSGSRPMRVSPSGDRRAKYLHMPHVNGDNFVGTCDTVSAESEPENFSDSDTDDEWDGCEVTAV